MTKIKKTIADKIASLFSRHKGFWYLFAANGFLWSWLFLIDDAKLSNSALVGYLTITLVFLTIVSIATAGFWLAIKYLHCSIKRSKRWTAILKVFFVWAFVELAVSWLVAVIWMGRNGSWSTVLPFSSLAPWLAWTPFKYSSRFVGYYGLSASVVTLQFMFTSTTLRRLAYIGPYLLVLLGSNVVGWRWYNRASGETIKVTIVAENLGQPKNIRVPDDSLLVILPEYGLDNYTSKTISQRLHSNGIFYFVGTQQVPGPNGFSNKLIFGSNYAGFTDQQIKSCLIPGGEYLSYSAEVLLKDFSKSTYDNFQVVRAVVKGHDKPKPFRLGYDIQVGSGACSSIIATEDYRSLVRQGATVLTNSASLDIFRGSRLFNMQHRGLAKFIATANARPFLQSSNNWPAFGLSQNGRQLAQLQPVGHTQVQITNNKTQTVYTHFGDWPAYVGGLWMAADIVAKLGRRFKV